MEKKEKLKKLIGELCHYLPHQGPISVFIHHNTLEHFEHMEFEKAVEHVASMRGTKPYMGLSVYQAAVLSGRIAQQDIAEALEQEGGDPERKAIRQTLLRLPVSEESDAAIQWKLREEGEIETTVLLGLWRAIAVRSKEYLASNPLYRREVSTLETELEHQLAQWSGAFLDLGVSAWTMPDREKGFWPAMRSLFGWKEHEQNNAITAIQMELEGLGIPESEWKTFLWNELVLQPGWAGTMGLLASLEDYLAVRLQLKRSYPTPIPVKTQSLGDLTRRFNFFCYAREVGMTQESVEAMTKNAFESLFKEIESFDDWTRRRVLHRAYEATYRRAMLSAVQANAQENRLDDNVPEKRPSFQAVFCIDDREESIRRHLEEVEPSCETLSFAGFYGIDMLYQGLNDSKAMPFCPAPVTPKHKIIEKPLSSKAQTHQERAQLTRKAGRGVFSHSRTAVTAAPLMLATGAGAVIPLFMRLFFPRLSTRVLGTLHRLFHPHADTELALKQEGKTEDGYWLGYSDEETADRVTNVLRSLGLTQRFAPIVFMMGHGSSNTNNPHESAYQCGACGGKRGAANGRAFASMANRPEIRELVRKRGINLPDSMHFVGGFHDTGNDDVLLYDLDKIPKSLTPVFEKARRVFDEARKRDAHERCRRFVDAIHLPVEKALSHVEQRARSIREARPECGHATNAVLIVGRRPMTQGLFLDRRAFLNSYDYRQDPEGTVLAGILGPAIVVCAGISLEYYFSFVDNETYGCGTKLPHNVMGLVGVVNGAHSDLQTGLPWQMVEIHEPMRLLTIIETTRAIFEKICDKNNAIGRLVRHHWIQVALREPSGKMYFYGRNGYVEFTETTQLPKVPRSMDYYVGKIDHLAPVKVVTKEVSDVA